MVSVTAGGAESPRAKQPISAVDNSVDSYGFESINVCV